MGTLPARRLVLTTGGHLADRLAASDTSDFDAAFDYIEHLILNGDAYVSELGAPIPNIQPD